MIAFGSFLIGDLEKAKFLQCSCQICTIFSVCFTALGPADQVIGS